MVVSTGTLGKDGKALDEGGLMMMNLLVTRLVMKVHKIMIMIGKQRFRSTGSKLWVLMAMNQMWGLVMSMTMLGGENVLEDKSDGQEEYCVKKKKTPLQYRTEKPKRMAKEKMSYQ